MTADARRAGRRTRDEDKAPSAAELAHARLELARLIREATEALGGGPVRAYKVEDITNRALALESILNGLAERSKLRQRLKILAGGCGALGAALALHRRILATGTYDDHLAALAGRLMQRVVTLDQRADRLTTRNRTRSDLTAAAMGTLKAAAETVNGQRVFLRADLRTGGWHV